MKTEHLWILALTAVSITWITSVTQCERHRIDANAMVGRISASAPAPTYEEDRINKEAHEKREK